MGGGIILRASGNAPGDQDQVVQVAEHRNEVGYQVYGLKAYATTPGSEYARIAAPGSRWWPGKERVYLVFSRGRAFSDGRAWWGLS